MQFNNRCLQLKQISYTSQFTLQNAIFAFVPAANIRKNKNNNTQENNDNKEIKDFALPACLEYQGMN